MHSSQSSRRSFLTASLGGAAHLMSYAALPARPNILLVLMDDLGYTSIGCYGNKLVPTPNLDRLAKEGIRFTDAYAAPQCTPTRATLMTGQYTAVNRMWHVIPPYHYPNGKLQEPVFRDNLDRSAFTIGKGLQQAGYRTACIGKWHLTTNEDGSYNGLNASASKYYGFDTVATPQRSPKEFATGDKAVNRFTDEAIEFIKASGTTPWFCYLAHHSIHRVVSAPDELIRKYRDKGYPEKGLNNATYLAAIEHFDAAVGRLVRTLDEMKLGSNTLVLFMSDNGGIYRFWEPNPPVPAEGQPVTLKEGLSEFSNAPLRAGKGSHYEGGIRVPFIARWTGTIRPGQTCETPVHIVDMMPTFFELARARTPGGYRADGTSLVPLFEGKKLADRAVYWYQPFYEVRWLATPSAIIREGDYKLIEFFGDYINDQAQYEPRPRTELYNVRKDIGETQNLAPAMPEKAAAMRKKLYKWIESTGSPVPGPNPYYDASQPLRELKGQPPTA